MLTLRVLLAAVATVTVARGACLSQDWKQYGDKCYWFSNGTRLTWNDANQICPLLFPGATLVSIHDAVQDAFIGEQVAGGLDTWIGLRCASGTASSAVWTDGTPYDYHHWSGGNVPVGYDCTLGECCAVINVYNVGDWYGLTCHDATTTFMCQLDAS